MFSFDGPFIHFLILSKGTFENNPRTFFRSDTSIIFDASLILSVAPFTMTLTSAPFQRLVKTLKRTKKTISFVEQCCGGVMSSSLMAQPGSSSVYWGGTVSYNSKRAKPLILNDATLHEKITTSPATFIPSNAPSSNDPYIQSKLQFTAEAAMAYCQTLGTDYAVAEGGAAGPTFRDDRSTGFAVVCVAGKSLNGEGVEVLDQQILFSDTADREANMRFFADTAAEMATAAIAQNEGLSLDDGEALADLLEKSEPSASSLQHVPFFLDRAAHLRVDDSAIAVMKAQAQFVVLKGRKVLVEEGGNMTKLATIHNETLERSLKQRQNEYSEKSTFLGLLHTNKKPVFGMDLYLTTEDGDDWTPAPGTCWADTRTTAPLFSEEDNSLALHATAFGQWQRNTKHCTACGGPMEFIQAGTCGQCQNCGMKSWPRQDPSMIALISSRDQQRVLLARSPRHPTGVHTVLAGFVEAGETMEGAVAREVFEETGVLIDQGSVRYIGTQPWPFPQSTMIGFTATADDLSQDIVIDPKEIVSAHWFEKEDVAYAAGVPGATMQKAVAEDALRKDPSLKLLVPPRGVIARKLIDTWLNGK